MRLSERLSTALLFLCVAAMLAPVVAPPFLDRCGSARSHAVAAELLNLGHQRP